MPPPRPLFLFTALALLLPHAALATTPGAPASVEAGLGQGVKIIAADGSMSLQVRARAQLRGVFTHNEDADEPLSEEFLIRRARLQLKGHALTTKFTYYIQLGLSNRDMESDLRIPLRDARINWAFSRDAELMAGQMKVPFNRQRTTSSSALQIMDRSLSNGELNLDRDVGVLLRSGDLFGWGERLGYEVGVFGGDGRNRTTDRGGLLYVARVELAPLGPLLGDEEADLQHSPLRVNVGLAAAYNAGTRRALSTHGGTFVHGVTDYTHAGADLAVRWRGASLNAELLMRRAADEVLTDEVDGMPVSELTRSGWGYMVQGGYLLTDTFELTGRYSAAKPLGVSAIEDAWEAGGGISWYIHEHALKLQSDYMRLGGADSKGAHQARLQLQFFF
jgi:hypothetical protein